ncbi:MAG: TIGR00725 family protein [Candidatus Tantalella remota]|nr:TIGR00725 family protein [Candidatus Tantalella remota]
MSEKKFLVSVIGGHKCDAEASELAAKIGEIVAEQDAVLVCGGLGGIMKAACRGAKQKGGLTVGIIPGEDKSDANEFVDVVIPTGMGYTRNTLVAGAADMIVALSGEYGTLSEIAFALNAGKPVYGLGAWDIAGVNALEGPEQIADKIMIHKAG